LTMSRPLELANAGYLLRSYLLTSLMLPVADGSS
jgi:hypothetical protein